MVGLEAVVVGQEEAGVEEEGVEEAGAEEEGVEADVVWGLAKGPIFIIERSCISSFLTRWCRFSCSGTKINVSSKDKAETHLLIFIMTRSSVSKKVGNIPGLYSRSRLPA